MKNQVRWTFDSGDLLYTG